MQYKKIRGLINEFRNLRRVYKDIREPDIVEQLNFNAITAHLTDLKEMIIDQNDWYQEIFYDDFGCSHQDEESHLSKSCVTGIV